MRRSATAVLVAALAGSAAIGAQQGNRRPPCAEAVAHGSICEPGNEFAVRAMRARNLVAAMVVHDVKTGALVVSIASRPDTLDVASAIRPLSFMKILLAASWWEHGGQARSFACLHDGGRQRTEISIHEMLVNGCDLPGRQMAVALARRVGRDAMVEDLRRYIGTQPALKTGISDTDWADAWSIGEQNVVTHLASISRFLQAVGNDGIAVVPETGKAMRFVKPQTTELLKNAMRDAVRRGTAQGSDADLHGTSWTIGGKTGSAETDAGQPLDGLFAGLIFAQTGAPRFTVVTYVKHGGNGGSAAARLSAQVARYLAGF